MRRHCFFLLLALRGAMTSRLAPASETNSPLSAWLAAQPNIHSWSADFIQTRMFKSLTQPLTSSGQVWFEEPNRFRWELGHPPQTIAVRATDEIDRKSTRLNSSHQIISYAVFCLKKKKKQKIIYKNTKQRV